MQFQSEAYFIFEKEKSCPQCLSLSSLAASKQNLFGIFDILFLHQFSLQLAALFSSELVRLIRTVQNILLKGIKSKQLQNLNSVFSNECKWQPTYSSLT